MTKLAPEWVRTSDPVIRSPARYCWTTAPPTGRKEEKDPSIFAIAFATLAVNVLGDIGPTARLRLISGLFIAGHDSCALH